MSYEAAPCTHHSVPIQLTRDKRLSFRARGIAIRLLSNAPGFRMTATDLARESPNEGRRAVLAAMKELRALGYAQVIRSQDGRGRWHTVTRIFGAPQPECAESTPATEVRLPNSGEPNPGKPASGKRIPKSSSTKKKYQEETTTTQFALDWSAKGLHVFTEEDRAVVVRMIEDHKATTQQDLLDEVAARVEDKAVSSHWGLLVDLAARAKAGSFRLSRGRRLRDGRSSRAQPTRIGLQTPGSDPETPYANAIGWAYQQFNVTGDRAALISRLNEAATRWPEEASRSSMSASVSPQATARNHPSQ